MSEIEKLYKNAGVEKVINYECTYDYGIACPNDNDTCDNCGYYKEKEPDYPLFTAEKQLKLLHLIITRIADIDRIYIECDNSTDKICFYSIGNEGDDCDTFENALASYINDIWQDLTEQERTEIRSILNG